MAGIKKIKIPVLPEELNIDVVAPYLDSIYDSFVENQVKAAHSFDILTAQHEILGKKRRYDDDSDINNIVIVPYIYEMIRFKTGYSFGNPKEYAQSKENQTDELKYLNRYSKDVNEANIDKNVANYAYTTGSGYYFIEPRRDSNFDSESESPYVIYAKSPIECAKIYSSYNGEPELFDMLVTKLKFIDEKGKQNTKIVLSLYLPNTYYEFENNGNGQFVLNPEKTKPRAVYKMLPLVEKYADENRIGIVELCEFLQNSIDKLQSDQIDNVDDLVNELLVFMNTVLGKDQNEEAIFLKNAKKNGVIVLNDKNPEIKADVKTLTQKLDYAGIITIIENLKRAMFDCCGVPIPSSDTSNGTKSGAVEKGNGYDNAYNRILDDYNSFIVADREVLKRKLFICKNFANSKVNALYASDIDIKYNPNMTDNMLTKSQSYVNFVEHGVPPVLAIQWCRISNDAITPANMIAEYKKQREAEEQSKLEAQQKAMQQNNINGGNTDNIQNG